MSAAGPSGGKPRFWNRPMTLTAEVAAWVFLVAGIAARLGEYAVDRTYYGDEIYLTHNLIGRPILDLSTPLTDDQLVPPGFLIVERVAAAVLGPSRRALRFFPLLSAIAGLFLMRSVAGTFLGRRAAPMAVAFLAVQDDLVYYSIELKQYSTDMAATLLCWVMASRVVNGGRAVEGAVIGGAIVWFSHPSAFVLGGVGSWLIVRAVLAKDRRRTVAFLGMVAVWLASFAGCYVASMRLLAPGPFMWTWWGFAFLPIPPTSWDAAERVGWSLANVLVFPVGLRSPLGVFGDSALGLVLFGLGLGSLWRRNRGILWLLTSPLLAALAASALHKYPFHGRLLYFAVPGLMLILTEGLAVIGRSLGWWVAWVVLGFLLMTQILAVESGLTRGRARPFDSHGDLRNDLLDELERRKLWPRPVPGHNPSRNGVSSRSPAL